jgi:MFS family permease
MVRKPFMLVGAIGTMVALFLLTTVKAGISFTGITLIMCFLLFMLSACFGPWFASFTETLEYYNPGLIATGSSLYGFGIRLVGVPFGLIIPHVLGSPVQTASGWRTWFWVCFGCVAVFIPCIFTMHGRWSPKKAQADFQEHEARVAAELARLEAEHTQAG